ncbi:late embryogenesis abundant protein 47-like [Andrographis paniculata]|uniref:late embryogenesis abundant protein 47-like n=1 Tax=Andrographis paniculata TaxID=175694 RepID=UPI0021E88C4E|nr:late embryogenesis abundant protein 47-like [Andrographis paniculata]
MSQDQPGRPQQAAEHGGGDSALQSAAAEVFGLLSTNTSDVAGLTQLQQRGNITIGEALEATTLTAGSYPVGYSDAAAIQAAEVRATGRTNIVPGGVAAAAQSAATRNARITRDAEKTKLAEVLSDARAKLPSDKPVTRRDAEGVIVAELRNDPNLCTRPGGVAASIAAAARLNQNNAHSNTKNNNNAILKRTGRVDANADLFSYNVISHPMNLTPNQPSESESVIGISPRYNSLK